MVLGLVLLTWCVKSAPSMLCVLAVCLISPLTASITYHQILVANWPLKDKWSFDKFEMLIELTALITTLTCLFLLNLFQTEAISVTIVSLLAISTICIGTSLGVFKKIANSKSRASPRFVTAFVFYVSFALVVLTPYLKYPSLAAQIHTLAIDETLEDQKSSYYSSRGIVIASFFVLGAFSTVSAFSICNAMQHPQIKQGYINLMASLIPVAIFAIFDFKMFGESLDVQGWIAVSIAFSMILFANLYAICHSK